ncbi:glycerol dehydratase reactivase beta/small subunit family protein [Lentilactobacillus sp. IMAU92037]|uniref:glycerol dehydratase reactivase beta/small subunit family protein n=1 Tax=Lentilactobacillus TaxID=2767893 RepID=UPI001C2536B4|nr:MULTISPECIES: glycerol dehydratase reactivase beta/small subunit family protein [Lentilactobacillus]MBU9788312.1 glycerol dehydratase reactivase beta/small subunit family protein [Lentilactobacillus dabitei]MBV0929299.1 glycerol dehydratase reactivase beta/small subunit family protein [Lentilactobacillus dabitei]MDM7516037.1 glycerol dehydratase reactivase beta/small subunit family protein [Lentilactobacillus sp. TOM.63]
MAIDNDRPAILIALSDKLNNKLPGNLEPMLHGIEEEQIPFQMIQVADSSSAVDRAYQAAVASRLSVGISFDDQQIVVHYKNLNPNEPLFVVPIDNPTNVRKIGANAARLVKGVPFKK